MRHKTMKRFVRKLLAGTATPRDLPPDAQMALDEILFGSGPDAIRSTVGQMVDGYLATRDARSTGTSAAITTFAVRRPSTTTPAAPSTPNADLMAWMDRRRDEREKERAMPPIPTDDAPIRTARTTGTAPTTPTDPDAPLRAEYRRDEALHRKFGITERDYIASRKADRKPTGNFRDVDLEREYLENRAIHEQFGVSLADYVASRSQDVVQEIRSLAVEELRAELTPPLPLPKAPAASADRSAKEAALRREYRENRRLAMMLCVTEDDYIFSNLEG